MPAWSELDAWRLAALGTLFVWSGFVRSGLGFGGAALTLPMLLLVVDEPLLFLPAICWHLLVFSSLTVATRLGNVDWAALGKLAALLAAPVAAGLVGLLNLPGSVLSAFVHVVTLGYGLMYVLGRALASRSGWTDAALLLVGGYASGTSLTGAPLIAAVGARRIAAHRVRDTLFVLWMALVLVKLSAFAAAGVDLQLGLAAATLPAVALGHAAGLAAHERILGGGRRRFERLVGAGLVAVSLAGLGAAAAAAARQA